MGNYLAFMQQCRLKRLYTRARHTSTAQRRRAEHRLSRLSFLNSPSFDLLITIPNKLTELYQSECSSPPIDMSRMPVVLVDPGKRQWETSQIGYMNWAVGQLVEKVKEEDGKSSGRGRSKFDVLNTKAEGIGSADGLRGLAEANAVSGNVDLDGESGDL
jgi:kinetochore protein Mis12/MTW1